MNVVKENNKINRRGKETQKKSYVSRDRVVLINIACFPKKKKYIINAILSIIVFLEKKSKQMILQFNVRDCKAVIDHFRLR